MMFVFLILLIVAALYFYQHNGLEGSGVRSSSSDHALEILRQRYAKGEISEQDFLNGKHILESH
ncbi:SHOCT domain-containing protein [Desulfitobacterium sp. Sab5]|uniref:SHOCT domain-containing protein n=1 Tax=Desulfitobacterium TaxID=36853 RepID=UPI003CF20C81